MAQHASRPHKWRDLVKRRARAAREKDAPEMAPLFAEQAGDGAYHRADPRSDEQP